MVQADSELKALEARPGTAEVLVVGTGYAGIELATTVAERLGSRGHVRMITAGRALTLPTSFMVHACMGVGATTGSLWCSLACLTACLDGRAAVERRTPVRIVRSLLGLLFCAPH